MEENVEMKGENGEALSHSKKSTSQLKKLFAKPGQTRDTKENEDSEKSDSESDHVETNGKEILNAVKEEAIVKKERAKYSKKRSSSLDAEEQVPFSFFNILKYIEDRTSGLTFFLAMMAYAAVGCILILSAPLLGLFMTKEEIPPLFQHITACPGRLSALQETFKLSTFFAAMFCTYIFVHLLVGRLVFICAMVCDIINHKVSSMEKIILFIIDDVKGNLAVFFMGIFGVVYCNLFLEKYSLTHIQVVGYGKLGAYSMCLSILMGFFIAEKFFLKLAIAYCGNNVFSGRIGDVNLKTSILRRLNQHAINENMGGSYLGGGLVEGIEVTETFLAHFPDFKLKSKIQCEDLVYEILSILSTGKENISPEDEGKAQSLLSTYLTMDTIREAFGTQWMDIWKYLEGHGYVKEIGSTFRIPGDCLMNLATSAYSERVDLKRTLYDRDKILGTLDRILQGVALILTLMLSTPFIGFDTVQFLAGSAPLIMGSGWLFADIIKDVFNNFIFLLHEHPFDVGDRIFVKGQEFTVLRIDLMYSTFTSKGGTVCYTPNKELIKESIFNVRRSDIQTEMVVFIINDELSIEKLDEIKEKALSILKRKELDTKKMITVQDYETQSDKTVLTFRIEYLCNFQDPEPKFTRRHIPLEIIQKAIRSAGFNYVEQKAESSI
ncbi:uncharacterized protein NEMAJ01_0034 [Nematocida major]|uniref:uncharacterized protein n=1 Tax=Nematocida major TaxID=1912982 RepID=UPI0020087658|nr:uncharacterized protein NEMAJ01_0034 [Nematocida major]KAH9385138.1 hypothetical protein NEMAJ01_0034 [Nematocida major]